MIPSFLPAHRRRPGAATTLQAPPLQVDPETGLAQLSLGQILTEARNYRFVDGCHIDYATLLQVEHNNPQRSPLSVDGLPIAWPAGRPVPRVLVVGAGLGGLLTALQLRKAGLQVQLVEAGAEPAQQNGAAGRIRAVNVRPELPDTSAELGAMRFPTTSYLFWHYLRCSGSAQDTDLFTAFPNVASVPSVFTGTDLSGVWAPAALDLPADYQALNQRHLDSFYRYQPPGGPAGVTVDQVATLLKKPPNAAEILTVQQFWNACIATLYGRSYRSFLEDQGFSADEIERIGYMGIGTGGFAPLFGVDVLDIMRLFLWGYSNEMAVPDLKRLPGRLLDLLRAAPVQVQHGSPAVALLYSPSRRQYSVGIQTPGFPLPQLEFSNGADYVVLAMTHVAARRLLVKSALFLPGNGFASDAIVPLYDPRYPGYASRIKPELNSQLCMSAVKIFHSIAGPARTGVDPTLGSWTRAAPPGGSPYDTRLRTCYGTFAANGNTVPLGVSYMLPRRGMALASSSTVLSLHYAWGEDADTVERQILQASPAAGLAIDHGGVYRGRNIASTGLCGSLVNALTQRFNGFATQPSLSGPPGKDLMPYFVPYRRGTPYADEGFFAAVYWKKVPYVWGGFKLDQPGVGAFLGFAYKLVTEASPNAALGAWDRRIGSSEPPRYEVHPALKGLYFSGDSFSNYGGWAEGAFQSALGTSAGIVKSAAQAAFGSNYLAHLNAAAIAALVDQARDPSSYARR